ncbi:maleylpyruvate isomerase family mycothiol-dependent enzyme [Micromonospora sp. NPDC005163]
MSPLARTIPDRTTGLGLPDAVFGDKGQELSHALCAAAGLADEGPYLCLYGWLTGGRRRRVAHYHAAMPTYLSMEDHLEALVRSGAALRRAAAAAGFDAKVPTCPGWNVTDLVTHQGMVHRWAAANLRGDTDHNTSASEAEAQASADLLGWYSNGLAALVDTLQATADDAQATVFLKDAPPPRRFWARRQAHETTIHSVDAVSAVHGRWPGAVDVDIDSVLAADGIDELLTGFIARGKGRLHSAEPYTVIVRTDDTGHAWTVRISEGPIVTTPGETERPDVVFSGTAVQLYLSLWNRANEIATQGRADVLEQWRSQTRIRWS